MSADSTERRKRKEARDAGGIAFRGVIPADVVQYLINRNRGLLDPGEEVDELEMGRRIVAWLEE